MIFFVKLLLNCKNFYFFFKKEVEIIDKDKIDITLEYIEINLI